MTDFATLVLGADTSGLERGERAMRRIQQEGGKTERVADEMTAAFGRAAKALGGMAAAYLSVSEVARASQTYQGLSNSLKGMGQTGAQAAATLREVNGIATRTRAPLEETARLYRRLSVAGADLGASSQDVARFAENVGLALGASGSSASEASDALTQLSQAMAGGKVQAEEFNSILDGAFPIAQAAARGIDEAGGSVGRLRKLVNEGEISSREFFDAILSQTDDLEAAFGRTVPTIAQGVSVLGNNFTMLVGVLDQSSGASEMVARAILAVGDGMAYLVDHADTVEAVMGRVASVGIAVAGVFATRAAVSIGTTYVTAAASAVRSTIALEMALGATSTRAAVASAATKALAGSMRVLRGALIATGIGALVVGAGEMIYQFGRLKEATGGWGNALSLLGEVASGVWEGIQTSAQAIPVGLESVWMSVKAGFLGMIADLQFNWFTFVNGVSRGLASVGADAASSAVAQYAEELGRSMDATVDQAAEYSAAAEAAKAEAASLATQGFDKAREAAAKLAAAVAVNSDETEDGTTAANRLNTALENVEDSAGGSSKAMKDAAKAAKEMADEIERLEFDADPVRKYNAQVAHLDELLKAGLSDRAYQYALQGFNDELASSLPLVDDVSNAFADWLVDGARDFKSFATSVFDSFKSLIADMIATAARNRILIGLGMTSTGTAAAASTATTAASSGLSSLGGLGSSVISTLTQGSGVIGGLVNGLTTSLSAFTNAGFGGLFSNVATQFGAISGSMGSIASALGSVLGPIGLVVGGFSLVKSLFGSSPDKTFNVESTALELAGYSAANLTWARSVARGNDGYDGNVVSKKDIQLDGFAEAMQEAQDHLFSLVSGFGMDTAGVIDAALAEAETRSKGWLIRREIDLEGLSDDEKAAAVLEFISDATGELAAFVPGLEAITRSGENGYEALVAMDEALTLVNMTADALGQAMLDVSLASGDAARQLVELFGDSSAYSSAVSNYVSLFYSETEQAEFALRSLTSAVEALGVTMPTTRAEYMRMIEAADLTTESGRTLYAALVSLASQFDAVLPSIESVSTAMQGLLGTVETGLESMISESTDAARASERAAQEWYAASDNLKDFVSSLAGGMSSTQRLAYLQSQVASTFAAARDGDIDAAQAYAGIATEYLSAAKANASNAFEYAAIQGRVVSQANMLSGIAKLEGASETVMADLYQQQVSILEDVQATLTSGGEITEAQLSQIDATLAGISGAIEAASKVTYSSIVDGLQGALTLAVESDLPEYVKNLLIKANDDVFATLNLAVMTAGDLSAEALWLAANGTSEHVTSLTYVVDADNLSPWHKALTARTVSDVTQNVSFVVTSGLSDDEMELALAGTSGLASAINVAITSDAAMSSIRQALENLSAYADAIAGAVATTGEMRDLILENGTPFALSVIAAFDPDLSEAARRVLLEEQGDYVTMITGRVNLSNLNRRQKALLDVVSGVTQGKVLLGGTFEYDPSAAFKAALETGITTPMDALRNSINALTIAVGAEVVRQEQANALAAAAQKVERKEANVASAASALDAVIASIEGLEASTGVTILNNGKDASIGYDASGAYYKATNVSYNTKTGDIAGFSDGYWSNGGLQDQLTEAMQAYNRAVKQLSNATGQYDDLLENAPSFDGGGFTPSIPRTGGVDGKGGFWAIMHGDEGVVDFTKTPTSAGTSSGSRSDISELKAELQRLNAEIAAMRKENTQLLLQQTTAAKKSADSLERIDRTGVKERATT